MLVSDFDYELPPELIAQQPLTERAGSRMLHLQRKRAALQPQWSDREFRDFPTLLRPGDLLVVNNTRVFPARLFGRRRGLQSARESGPRKASPEAPTGRIEVLLTRQSSTEPNEWECLVRPSRTIGVGEKLCFEARERPGSEDHRPELEAEVIARGDFGERRIRFAPVDDFFFALDRVGHVPLPPYIRRQRARQQTSQQTSGDEATDRERYQTVYAQDRGSVAAPTAGLHFTSEILGEIHQRGIEVAEITLHVGLGTFQPIRVEKVEDHKLHRECYEISAAAAAAINRAKAESRRIVAVGTTTVRTLEHAAQSEGSHSATLSAGSGEADVFIYPGYSFRVVDALLTNFHLPQSTLLMLVCALAGKDSVLDAYRHAVAARYRFFSYGDCMFVE